MWKFSVFHIAFVVVQTGAAEKVPVHPNKSVLIYSRDKTICVLRIVQNVLTRSIPLCVITTGTEKYSLAQQYVFKLIKPGYMFQLYSHH
jgi:hypothetical protein